MLNKLAILYLDFFFFFFPGQTPSNVWFILYLSLACVYYLTEGTREERLGSPQIGLVLPCVRFFIILLIYTNSFPLI